MPMTVERAAEVSRTSITKECGPHCLTISELRRLLAVAPAGRDRLLIELLTVYGLRSLEVHRLNVGDLVRAGGVDKLHVRGNGRVRVVSLHTDTATALRDTLDERDALRDDAPLFVSACHRTRGERLSLKGIREIVDRAAVAARVHESEGKRVGTNTLRHTFTALTFLAGTTSRRRLTAP